jgi:two-component system chemotaxis sensor kinase CheA
MSELDMSQYLDLFLQEANEQLEILEQETLQLENDPSTEHLQIIFRAAHTLKGSSRAMGFGHFAEVTHEMENLLELLRSNSVPVTSEVIDTLFLCLDALTKIKDQISSGAGDALDCNELVDRLRNLSGSAGTITEPSPTGPQKPEKRVIPDLPEEVNISLGIAGTQSQVWHGKFRVHIECAMKWVRAFMVLNALEENGEILVTLPFHEQLEEENFDQDFDVYFQTTESIDLVKVKLEGIAEIESWSVDAWSPNDDDIEIEVTVAKQEIEPTKQPEVKCAEVAQGTPTKKAEAGQTVRVDVARLDELMNLVGELVIDRTRIAQIGSELAAKYEYDHHIEALGETVGHISRISTDLQEQIMKARMLPVDTVFNRFPRVIRDLSQKVGKDIRLAIEGGETELDRSVIEVIGDPLLHILRNSCDHAIESPQDRKAAGKPSQGVVTLLAKHEENHIVISIQDDGKGIDPDKIRAKAVATALLTQDAAARLTDKEALNLIFHSGLSTAEQVTDVSGRGVGMDIVRSGIQKLGGIIDIESEVGKGTKFSLRLPLTLAIIRGLLVKVAGVVYVLPLGSVIETLLVKKTEVKSVHKRKVILIRGLTTPLVRLRDVFTTRDFSKEQEESDHYVVIVGFAEQRIGLVVDSLIGEQEVVIKSLSRFCGDVRGISGATILGDGNVALIVDVNGLIAGEKVS